MSLWSKWSSLVDVGLGSNAPAIWLYPEKEQNISVRVEFQGEGFMTLSSPPYNTGWIVNADPSAALPVIRGVYDDSGARTYLDYDGFRDGDFQTTTGWVVEKSDLLRWQRAKLAELGFRENEIDDVNYSYGRLLQMRDYPERFFLVHPQIGSTVDKSVALEIHPKPDSVYRLWLYFVPSFDPPKLVEPKLKPIVRKGFSAIELGFLTASERTPALGDAGNGRSRAAAPRRLAASPRFAVAGQD